MSSPRRDLTRGWGSAASSTKLANAWAGGRGGPYEPFLCPLGQEPTRLYQPAPEQPRSLPR